LNVIRTSMQPSRLLRLKDMMTTTWYHRKQYKIAQVDVYSGLAFTWAEVVCWTLRLAGKPYILTLHGGNLPAFARQWPGRVYRLLHSASVVTTPSRYIVEAMHCYREDMRLLPNAIDLSQYVFRLREHPLPKLVWLRAFHKIYNPTLAARSLKILASDFPDVHLTMVGPDKGDGSLELVRQSAEELGVGERLSLPGGVSKTEVPYVLNQGDVFLNTTNVDTNPVSVLEAMACGLCVVSTKVGGIPYMLEHEEDALLVLPNHPEDMAAAVRRVLTEPGLARRLSYNARKKAEQFDWSVIFPKWDNLFKQVMADA
jgi:glycosyltransferase involved in cell wall biosynthesis